MDIPPHGAFLPRTQSPKHSLPVVGEGATVYPGNGVRFGATVLYVSRDAEQVVLQGDRAIKCKGLYPVEYDFRHERDADGPLYIAVRQEEGFYRLAGHVDTGRVNFGFRDTFYP